MKLFSVALSALLSTAAVASTTIVEQNFAGESDDVKIHEVCVSNLEIAKYVGIETKWNVARAHRVYLGKNTTMLYRLIAPADTKEVGFTAAVFNLPALKEKEALEIVTGVEKSTNCDKLPTYELKVVKQEEKDLLALVKKAN